MRRPRSGEKIFTPAFMHEQFEKNFSVQNPCGRLVLVTGHRRENFGISFEHNCQALARVATSQEKVQLVYPVRLTPKGLSCGFWAKSTMRTRSSRWTAWLLFSPWTGARPCLNDSSGLQKEAPSLGKQPVLVKRDTLSVIAPTRQAPAASSGLAQAKLPAWRACCPVTSRPANPWLLHIIHIKKVLRASALCRCRLPAKACLRLRLNVQAAQFHLPPRSPDQESHALSPSTGRPPTGHGRAHCACRQLEDGPEKPSTGVLLHGIFGPHRPAAGACDHA
ncbi:UDP-N-acetylglucosamine 2-epimerase [Polaromonas sp. CG_9.11]|uniref:UDP-N-acetylglucosamine 2-epimerase n=1 Tax=Polaromonas sp. CG_9.11 TaxID=2787730 RepID=UPI00351C0D47